MINAKALSKLHQRSPSESAAHRAAIVFLAFNSDFVPEHNLRRLNDFQDIDAHVDRIKSFLKKLCRSSMWMRRAFRKYGKHCSRMMSVIRSHQQTREEYITTMVDHWMSEEERARVDMKAALDAMPTRKRDRRVTERFGELNVNFQTKRLVVKELYFREYRTYLKRERTYRQKVISLKQKYRAMREFTEQAVDRLKQDRVGGEISASELEQTKAEMEDDLLKLRDNFIHLLENPPKFNFTPQSRGLNALISAWKELLPSIQDKLTETREFRNNTDDRLNSISDTSSASSKPSTPARALAALPGSCPTSPSSNLLPILESPTIHMTESIVLDPSSPSLFGIRAEDGNEDDDDENESNDYSSNDPFVSYIKSFHCAGPARAASLKLPKKGHPTINPTPRTPTTAAIPTCSSQVSGRGLPASESLRVPLTANSRRLSSLRHESKSTDSGRGTSRSPAPTCRLSGRFSPLQHLQRLEISTPPISQTSSLILESPSSPNSKTVRFSTSPSLPMVADATSPTQQGGEIETVNSGAFGNLRLHLGTLSPTPATTEGWPTRPISPGGGRLKPLLAKKTKTTATTGVLECEDFSPVSSPTHVAVKKLKPLATPTSPTFSPNFCNGIPSSKSLTSLAGATNHAHPRGHQSARSPAATPSSISCDGLSMMLLGQKAPQTCRD